MAAQIPVLHLSLTEHRDSSIDDQAWSTYGMLTSNTFGVQAVDSAGNRSPASSVMLTNQTC
jgi:hypothetical protein